MGIRVKIAAIVFALMALAVGIYAFFAQTILLDGFRHVEDQAMQKNVLRGLDSINSELRTMSTKSADWAYWDDTYQYVLKPNQLYETANLVPSLASTGITYWLFFNSKNQLIKSVGFNADSLEPTNVPNELSGFLNPQSPLLNLPPSAQEQEAVLNLPSQPYLAVARKIFRSDKSGPAAGTLVISNALDATKLQQLNKTSHLTMELFSADSQNLPSDVRAYGTGAPTGDAGLARSVPISANEIKGYLTLPNQYGLPLLVLRVSDQRDIYQEGRGTINSGLIAIIVLMASIAVAIDILLLKFVSAPIERLVLAVGQIARRERTSLSLESKRRDEVGRLSGSIQQMVNSLERAQNDIEAAKKEVDIKVEQRTHELSEARRELELAHTQLEASIRSLPFGFALVDSSGTVHFTNRHIRRGRGSQSQDHTLAELEKAYGPDSQLTKTLEHVLSSRKSKERLVGVKSRFYRILVAPVATSLAARRAMGAVILVRDVTDELATQRARDEFFSIASHELRTPLTAIRGNSALVLEHFTKDIKSRDHREMVEDIHDASVRLIGIVNDFLDSSRLEMGKVTYKIAPVDAPELLRRLHDHYKDIAHQRGIKLEVEAEQNLPLAIADADRVRQILVNLLGNALRYTEKGMIQLKAKRVGDRLLLSVTDTGAGIPTATQYLLFRKFQQAGTSLFTRDGTKSTGLGLYISKMLAEGMKGSLYLESSRVGVGSTFVLELPLAQTPATPDKP